MKFVNITLMILIKKKKDSLKYYSKNSLIEISLENSY